MDELRWILLVLGAMIVAGVYFFSRSGPPSGPRVRQGRRDEPELGLDEELDRLGEGISADRWADAESLLERASGDQAEIQSDPDEIVTLYLQPRDAPRLSGAAVFDAAEGAGLTFGRFNIFHRFHEAGERRVAVFSVANMTKPGEFDPDNRTGTECRGLCLFLTLPNPLSALDAWDAMLAAGQRLADLLDGELQDEEHAKLSRQRIAHIRDQMREYDRRRDLPRI